MNFPNHSIPYIFGQYEQKGTKEKVMQASTHYLSALGHPMLTVQHQWHWRIDAADMENVRNFTRAGLLFSRFYPKVRELRQFWKRDKTACLQHLLGNHTQAG